MNVIEYTRCPKCGTLFDVSNIDFSDSEGWVQCGDCTHQFRADKHAVNYSSLLEQSILANMDEMSKAERDFSIGELDLDTLASDMNNMSVSEHIDLFDYPTLEENSGHDDFAEVGLAELTTPEDVDKSSMKDELQELDDAIHKVLQNDILKDDLDATSSPDESADELPVQAEISVIQNTDDELDTRVLTEESQTQQSAITTQLEDSSEIDDPAMSADFDNTSTESIGSKLLLASLALPLLLALLIMLVFQLQQRGTVDWIPEPYQTQLQTGWLSFLAQKQHDQVDLSKIHLSSTRMEPHPTIAGATTIILQLINRADTHQSYPNFELSFTDSSGNVIARRILQPFDYLDADQLNRLESKQAKTLHLNLAGMPEGAVGYEIQVTLGS